MEGNSDWGPKQDAKPAMEMRWSKTSKHTFHCGVTLETKDAISPSRLFTRTIILHYKTTNLAVYCASIENAALDCKEVVTNIKCPFTMIQNGLYLRRREQAHKRPKQAPCVDLFGPLNATQTLTKISFITRVLKCI